MRTAPLKTKKPDDAQRKKAQMLMGEITAELKNRFTEISKSNSPSTGKGIGYEDAVATFLRSFFDSSYRFYNRAQLVDHVLDVTNLFPGNMNEWDVVAVYRTAIPDGLLSPGKGKSIGYDSVAFIVQVAQDLEPKKLSADFERFETLNKLTLSDMRNLSMTYSGKYVTPGPFRVLMYGKAELSEDTLRAELEKHPAGFDCLVLVDEDLIAFSSNNPFSAVFAEGKPNLVIAHGETLFYLIANLFLSVRRYSSIDLFQTIWNIRNAAAGYSMVSEGGL